VKRFPLNLNRILSNLDFTKLLQISPVVTLVDIPYFDEKIKEVPDLPEDLDELLDIIRANGNRITQRELLKKLSYSESKFSLMLSDLEERGLIEKFKRGRGSIIRIPDVPLPKHPTLEMKKKLMEKALDAASTIQDDYQRVEAISALISNFDGKIKKELMEKALDAASTIQDDFQRVMAISALIPNFNGKIKEELMEKVLDAASVIQNDSQKAHAISALISNFDGKINLQNQ